MANTLLDYLKLNIIPALANGSRTSLPNYNQPAQEQVPQQPLADQVPAALPIPQSLSQPANQGGGGFINTLANMGKSALGTAAETLPVALTNYALFGNTPMGQIMTRDSLIAQLEEKKEARKVKKQNMTADFASWIWSTQKSWKDKGFDVDIPTAFFSEQPTGNPELDQYLQTSREALTPLFKDGTIDSGDVLEAIKKNAEYDKILEGEKPTEFESKLKMYETDPDKYKDFTQAGMKPKNIDPLSDEGIALGLKKQEGIAKINAAYRKPDEPKNYPITYRREINPENKNQYKRIREFIQPGTTDVVKKEYIDTDWVTFGKETMQDKMMNEVFGEDIFNDNTGITPQEPPPEKTILPKGLTEETIQYNMKKYGKTRQEVIDKFLKGKK